MLTKRLNSEVVWLTDEVNRYLVDVHGNVDDELTGQEVVFTLPTTYSDHDDEVAEIYYMGKYRTLPRRWIVAMAFKPLFKLGEDIFNWTVLVDSKEDTTTRPMVDWLIWKPPVGGQPCPEIEGFNVIPGFSAYAVSKDGRAYTRFTNKIAATRKTYSRAIDRVRAPENYYLNMNVRTESLHATVIGIHRAIMLAYSDYGNDVNYLTVNHKNGQKRDNRFDNLEWTTQAQNSAHALSHVMRDIGDEILVKDYVTDEVTYYKSLSALSRALSIGTGTIRDSLTRIGGLIQGRYAVKRIGSDEKWPDYSKEEIDQIQARFKDWKLNLRCMARCIDTDVLIHAPTPTELSKEVGLTPSTVIARLKAKTRWPCNGFEFYYYRDGVVNFFRTYTDKEKKFFSRVNVPRVPMALYPSDDRSDFILFDTVRDLAKYLDAPESSIHTLLKTTNVFPTSKLGKNDGLIVERLVYENNL